MPGIAVEQTTEAAAERSAALLTEWKPGRRLSRVIIATFTLGAGNRLVSSNPANVSLRRTARARRGQATRKATRAFPRSRNDCNGCQPEVPRAYRWRAGRRQNL